MKSLNSLQKFFGILLVLAFVLSLATLPASAAYTVIPEGATITSATFSIYITIASGETVNVHRITAPWTEMGVTWANFGGSYDPAIVGSFTADGIGWRSVNVTALVQAWVNGVYPNYGLLLEQGQTVYTRYASSESGPIENRPKLEICYIYFGGSDCVTIQRPGAEPGDVMDAYIHQLYPTYNYGWANHLYTGLVGGYEKQSLLRFDFDVVPQGEGCTPGYWKNHFEDWPPTGYAPGDDFDTTFEVDFFDPDITLGEAVWAKGGGYNKIARHGTAALLSAAHPEVNYPYEVDEVIAFVQGEDVELLVAANELGCMIP